MEDSLPVPGDPLYLKSGDAFDGETTTLRYVFHGPLSFCVNIFYQVCNPNEEGVIQVRRAIQIQEQVS